MTVASTPAAALERIAIRLGTEAFGATFLSSELEFMSVLRVILGL
jgi:hypothetical protein